MFFASRYLLIFEFDGRFGDWMSAQLLLALKTGGYAERTKQWKGVLPGLMRGGLSPRRLINLGWLGLRSLLGLLFVSRHTVVVIRSTPPLLHLVVAMLCRRRGIPCVFWLMDYHPVLEQRLWGGRRWMRALLGWLDRWDRRALASFSRVVVLDEAMAELVRQRNPAARVVIHPTWGSAAKPPSPVEGASLSLRADGPVANGPGGATERVVFAYLGSFGLGHDWEALAACIREVAKRRAVGLLTIGVPGAAEPLFEKLAREIGAVWEKHPRMAFEQAAALLREGGAAWGCVTMRADLAGCLSPSKFSGYLAAGVPLLYCGPEKTNAWSVCSRFGGGVSLGSGASADEFARVAGALSDAAVLESAREGALKARAYFDSFNGETLARMIAADLETSAPRL